MGRLYKLLLIFLALLSTNALALELYSGEVVVLDQGARERLQAVPAALIQVLQKHSGQRELPIHPALDAALVSASRIVVSFHYREHKLVAPDGTQSREWHLVANFLPEAIDRIVREMGLPRWRVDRRPITIWVVVDDGLGRRLLPVEYEYAWNALKDIADTRGLPLFWPDLDDEQMESVDLQLLWGGFTDELPRLGTGGGDVVIVAARREGPTWNVRWNFDDGDETRGWRTRDTDLSFAMVDGLHRLTEYVSARDAIASSGQGQWQSEIRVTGFRNADDYVRCLAYLEGLGVVENVDVLEAGQGAIRFSIELNAMPEYLGKEIERDNVLVFHDSENEYSLVIVRSSTEEGPN